MPVKKLRRNIVRAWYIIILVGVTGVFCSSTYAGELQPGSRFKITRSIYLAAVYDDVENKQLTKETARGYLNSTRLYNKRWIAFQSEVPVGTIMTIIEPTSRVWPLPFFAKRYLVHLDPDPSRGLDIILSLNGDLDGDMDGLNPEIFGRENE